MSNDTTMFTQCPDCQTVFRVTMDQLKMRDGLVRCGKCSKTFQADQHLYADLQVRAPKKAKAAAQKKTPKTKTKSAPAKSAPKAADAEPEMIEVTAAPAPWTAPDAPTAETQPASAEKPKTKKAKPEKPHEKSHAEPEQISLAPLLERRTMQAPQSVWWIVGSALLFLAFVAQLTYFYRDRLAQYPTLRPFILGACENIGCVVHPHSNVNAIELVEPTGISPHPSAANALRLRATLVNRATKAQPYPLMQVTLTDATGQVLSRRTFAPKEYLEQPSMADSEMPPHLAISALLDLTNPEEKAVGYQIDFVPAPIN